MLDVEALRADTPGCAERIHFNNAGASLMPQPVVDTVVRHLELEARIGGYEAAAAEAERVEAVYRSAARLVGAEPEEIALLENATRAWSAVFQALPFEPGDRILTGHAEYSSNYLAYLHASRTRGVEIVVVGDDEHGRLDVRELADRIDGRTKLISVSQVPTSGGLVNPAAEIGRVARDAGIPFLLDACQSIGQLPIDVRQIGCDFLSTTGRKFLRGPRGTGFLYVARERIDELRPALVEVGSADWTATDDYALRAGARRFETWESSYALQLGLGRAIDYALDLGLEAIRDRVVALADELRERLGRIDGVTVRDLGVEKCGIVTFDAASVPTDRLRDALAARSINVDISKVEDSRLDFEVRNLGPLIRASVHYFNTSDEIDRFAAEVAGAAA